MPRPKKLKNIDVDEVSIVDEPATGRQFMFWKSAGGEDGSAFEKQFKSLKVEFETDGSAEGSSLKINGKEIAELISATLSVAPIDERMSVYCTYTKGAKGETADGFRPSHTYTLSKSNGDDTPTAKAAKRFDPGDIETIETYLDELPPELRRSMTNVIGAARETGEPVEKEKETTVPEPEETQDGQEKPAKPAADLSGVVDAVDKLAGVVGAVAEKVTAIETAEKERREAAEKAAEEAAAHKAAVETGDELEFESEEDAMAAIASDANEEAIREADES